MGTGDSYSVGKTTGASISPFASNQCRDKTNDDAIPPLPVLFIVKCLIKNMGNCTVYFLEAFFSHFLLGFRYALCCILRNYKSEDNLPNGRANYLQYLEIL
jgi:hypothetical protein